MCGILYRQNGTREQAEKALEAIAHRGPDSRGLEKTQSGYIGATRLAIVDVANGTQPIKTEDKAICAFNGEVYNHKEIRKALEARGRRFKTKCDTEVVANAVAEFGEKAPENFDGQFAYVVEKNGKVYAARDHFGVSPLFFGQGKNGLVITSEVSALLANGVPGENVRRLPQGCRLEYNPKTGEAKLERYYDFRQQIREEKADPDKLFELMKKAVSKRVPLEVDHATILSGIDSCTATYLAHLQAKKPKMAYTVATNPDSLDVQCARALSKQLGIEHKVLLIDEQFAAENIKRAIEVTASPLYFVVMNALPQLRLADEIKKDRIKVIMNGTGSDELNLGYMYLWEIFDPQFLRENALNLMQTVGDNECYRDDKVFASQGLEVRPPFLDRELAEHAWSTPLEERLPELSRTKSKWQLRQAMRGKIPDLIVDREKENLYLSTGMMPLLETAANRLMSDEEYQKHLASLKGTGWDYGYVMGGKSGALFHKTWQETYPELAQVSVAQTSCGFAKTPDFDNLDMLSKYWATAPAGINLRGWTGKTK